MTAQFPDELDSAEHARVAMFREVFFGRGWIRHLPASAILPASALVNHGPMSESELLDWIRAAARGGEEQGLDASAWDPLKVWTDEECAEDKESWRDTPFELGPDAPADAAAANAEEVQDREDELARFDTYSAALRVAPVRTMRELLAFMSACGVVLRQQSSAEVTYELNPNVALPTEVLPLSEEAKRREDELRWVGLHESAAQEIIRLFDPDGEHPLGYKRTSLQRLARELRTDVEGARAGALNLLREGDFSATIDLERAEEHQVFDLVVDWDLFAQTRLSLRVGSRTEDE